MIEKERIRKKIKILRKKNYSLDENAPWKAAKNFFFYLKNVLRTPSLVGHFRYHTEVSTESPDTFESQNKTLGSLLEPAGRIRGKRFIFGASNFLGM